MAVPTPGRRKTAFKKARSIAPLYTGGPVAVTPDGLKIVTCVGDDVLYTDVSTGLEIGRFATDSQTVTALCISPSSTHLVVFLASLVLRIYELPTVPTPLTQPIRIVSRAHEAPVHVCKIDPTSTYLASGSADGVVKVWDILRGYVTHVFKGHGGVVSALTYSYRLDPSSVTQKKTMQLITASVDTRIRIFELSATSRDKASLKPVAVLEGHVSVPRGIDVSEDGKWMITGGRDSVVLVWDISKMPSTHSKKGKESAPKLIKTIPVLERVEAVGFLRQDENLPGASSVDRLPFYTGGEKGILTVWDINESRALFSLGKEDTKISDDQEEQRQIVDIIYTPSTSTLVSVHADQNILFHSISTQSLVRQLVGFNDEIVDATFLSDKSTSPDSHLALATNSSLIRVYSTSSLDSRLLEGHADIVLSLDHSSDGNLLASSSKDRTARIWAPSPNSQEYRCVAVCEGHAESVGAIALSRQGTPPRFIFTGSQDRTIKMWDLSELPSSEVTEPLRCKSLNTHKAHEKDINSLDVSPNDKLLASGSQDRTAKIYEIDYSSGKSIRGEIRLLGVCKGHKRGVWNVRFGRTERVLATASGDKTVKLWSLDDFSCVKTFEGHTNSVLRVDFLNQGMQLVSAASDGLVKLWNIREEECAATLDNHEEKVWALAVSTDERTIVSGSADSVVTFWEDCTEEEQQEKEAQREDMAAKDQDFLNYLSLNDYRKAIQLALAMEQPGRLFTLFKTLRTSASTATTFTGDPAVDQVIRTLGGSDLAKLLRFVRDWNANAKSSIVAQAVLFAISKLRTAEDIMKAFEDEASEGKLMSGKLGKATSSGSTALKEMVDALLPYSERHLGRIDALLQDSYMVDYILSEMDDGMLGTDFGTEMDVD